MSNQHPEPHQPSAEPATATTRTYLECPCCGDDGAESDADGLFTDGQPLICGCPGWVSADSDGDDSWAWINNGDEPCQKCDEAQSASNQVAIDEPRKP